ncbi:hypothetical protein B0H11DRAFT_2228487 [Mycena galericulata]|nr:hypothetical protein B0H11DRAFT_2228487 [Mycena galericulata]
MPSLSRGLKPPGPTEGKKSKSTKKRDTTAKRGARPTLIATLDKPCTPGSPCAACVWDGVAAGAARIYIGSSSRGTSAPSYSSLAFIDLVVRTANSNSISLPFILNNRLYLLPMLTSDVIPPSSVLGAFYFLRFLPSAFASRASESTHQRRVVDPDGDHHAFLGGGGGNGNGNGSADGGAFYILRRFFPPSLLRIPFISASSPLTHRTRLELTWRATPKPQPLAKPGPALASIALAFNSPWDFRPRPIAAGRGR